MDIQDIKARQIYDSRGNPTVEADVILTDGAVGRAAVPSGASTGEHEAHELRDGGEVLGGKGVSQAVKNVVEELLPKLKGVSVKDQAALDRMMIELDGTPNKSRLGANAILAVSLAAAHAAANANDVPLYRHIAELHGTKELNLPMPMVNIFNGGAHASGSTAIQEFMVVPTGADSIKQALRISAEVFHSLAKVLKKNGLATTVGDEGGYAPSVDTNERALELISEAVEATGYRLGQDVKFALDVAASELFENGQYQVTNDTALDTDGMIDWLAKLTEDYPIVSIEDGLEENDFAGWAKLNDRLKDIQIVGDDLLVTNQQRLGRAIEESSASAILIKLNQIGTVSETLGAIRTAQDKDMGVVISHRSGETSDTSISHLAVGTGAGQIKTGSMSRGERVAKYNELLRIVEGDSELKLARSF